MLTGHIDSELRIFTSKQTELKVQARIQVIVKKILLVTLGNINGPWVTFYICCLGHSDLNSHFKNLNTSNAFLTLGKPHKPKHTLSTLFPSMIPCVICVMEKYV